MATDYQQIPGLAQNQDVLTWLAGQQPEEVIEPELPIVDAHHHLWAATPWGVGTYLLPQMLEDIASGGHNVLATVHVQGLDMMYDRTAPPHLRCVGETRFIQGISAMAASGHFGNCRVAAAIVGFADLTMGAAVREVLDCHMQCPGFCGIRQIPTAVQGDLYSCERFRDGFAVLAEYNLIFEQWCPDYTLIPSVTRLAKAFPNVTIVLNHLGGSVSPQHMPLGSQRFIQWQADLTQLAECQNVYCKIGGAQMGAKGFKFGMDDNEKPVGSVELAQALLPWFGFAISTFGPTRCMFESNFPVDKTEANYRTLWNCFKLIAAELELSAEDKASIFSDTACKVYSLQIIPNAGKL